MSKVSNYARHALKLRSWQRLFSHVTAAPRRAMIARKLAQQKQRRAGQHYNPAPRVSAVLQFFNKRANIPMLWRGLEAAGFDEVVVLDDGSVDGSSRDWHARLTGPNHFLMRSNDLFEIITYDRAMRYSQAEIVCLLQDDDKLPSNRQWVDRAISLFEQFPKLIYLGGFRAADVLPREDMPLSDNLVLEVDNDVEYVRGLFRHRTRFFPQRETPSGIPDFFFAMSVVRAPVFIRRREFLEIGGFDLNFAPFLVDDVDNSIRAWRAGYQVGLYEVDFRRDIGLGGMRAFNGDRMERQTRLNWEKIYQKHGESIVSGELTHLVEAANRQARELNP